MAFRRMRSPAIYHREPLENLIHGLIGDVTFDDLERPLIVNTVDLNSGMQVFWGAPGLTDVRVADAVYASLALPGFLPPMEIRGRFFMDGAAAANLPVGIATAYQRDLVVAVDVGSSGALRAEVQDAGFAAVYARAIEIGIDRMRDAALQGWDHPPLLLLQPRVEHLSMFAFDQSQWLIDEGYRVTHEVIADPTRVPPSDARGVHPRRRIKLSVVRERCIGCGACLAHAPAGVFSLDQQGKAVVNQPDQVWSPIDGAFMRHCPTYAIVARTPAGSRADGQ
jgi:NTE family protein